MNAPATTQATAAELRALFQAATDAILISDDEGRMLDVNPAACELFGRTREQLSGRRAAEFVETGFDFEAEWNEFVRLGLAHLEFRVMRPDGELRNVECSARANFWPGRHFCFLRDITARLRLEEKVRHAHKMEAVSRVVGGLAHDFNNLLTAVMVYAGLLRAEVSEPARAREHVREIEAAGERGAALVGQLLALTRKPTFEPRVLSLGDTLEAMHDLLQGILGGEIALVLQRNARADVVRMDPAQLQQIVLNLALNARDAMPGGGNLVITIEEVEVARGRQRRMSPGSYVVLRVRDTGCGMDPETRARIFEPFFTTKGSAKGSGLGLPTVYGMVRHAGGGVDVESAPGRGTEITVYLPQVFDKPHGIEEPPVGATAALGARILLVEDDVMVRQSLVSVLAAAGCEVLAATSLREAVSAAQGARGIDLLVTDPVAAGSNIAREVQRLCPAVKVLLLCGSEEAAVTQPAGVSCGVLKKPFSAERLVQKVGSLLEPSR